MGKYRLNAKGKIEKLATSAFFNSRHFSVFLNRPIVLVSLSGVLNTTISMSLSINRPTFNKRNTLKINVSGPKSNPQILFGYLSGCQRFLGGKWYYRQR